MTTQEVIALAKEKLGKDITEQEAQNYIDGKAAIPDEALDIVSGGIWRADLPHGGGVDHENIVFIKPWLEPLP